MEKTAVVLSTMFDGLFGRALKPLSPELVAGLKRAGFDPERPLARYPVTVWEDCVDAAAQQLFPGVPRDQAWERIGRLFIKGYFETVVGRIIGNALPFMSDTAFINRTPLFMSTGIEGQLVSLDWHDAKRATLRLARAGDEAGALMAGVIAGSFERMRRAPPGLSWTSAYADSSVTIVLR